MSDIVPTGATMSRRELRFLAYDLSYAAVQHARRTGEIDDEYNRLMAASGLAESMAWHRAIPWRA